MKKSPGHFETNTRYLLLFVYLGVLLVGIAYALAGATPTEVGDTRWSGPGAGSIVTEGGNITAVNVASVSLTDRWAAFFGNVSGTINLTDGASSIYSWSWSATSGGKICTSQSSSVSGAYAATTGAAVDTAWGFPPTAADRATNTFSTANCSMTFATATVTDTANVTHKGSSNFGTCALTVGGTAKTNYYFCTNINSTGSAFNGQGANYEVIVPVAYGPGTETYYFYAELN